MTRYNDFTNHIWNKTTEYELLLLFCDYLSKWASLFVCWLGSRSIDADGWLLICNWLKLAMDWVIWFWMKAKICWSRVNEMWIQQILITVLIIALQLLFHWYLVIWWLTRLYITLGSWHVTLSGYGIQGGRSMISKIELRALHLKNSPSSLAQTSTKLLYHSKSNQGSCLDCSDQSCLGSCLSFYTIYSACATRSHINP